MVEGLETVVVAGGVVVAMASLHCRASAPWCRWPEMAATWASLAVGARRLGRLGLPSAPAGSVERRQCARAGVCRVAMLVRAREAGVGVTQAEERLTRHLFTGGSGGGARQQRGGQGEEGRGKRAGLVAL
ncbi:hypothetical protein P171DRAFT_447150 [Karstenula rhodostoma CBS 690.94]|uniref:Uncharacterized protein n=1 Tax=Karstenula rhodostoma CBS 690.94 TaxID=1392251 RepID=A0A9P4PA86_9PLEO|nr:hypothetical protein P171DRAFT_447150 [Karstenula rhodostoma CBS 690.94]